MSKNETYVGIDVAQDHLDVQVSGETAPWRVPHTEAGLETLCTRLASSLPARVVVEATGGLELPVAQALSAAGHAVARVNPRHVRDFGRALGYRAQTDAIDAALLARFAEQIRPAVRPLPDVETQALRGLVGRRRIVACPDPKLLEALCAFADHLTTLPGALAGGANSMTAVAAFTLGRPGRGHAGAAQGAPSWFGRG